MLESFQSSRSRTAYQIVCLFFLLLPTIGVADEVSILNQWRGQSRINELKVLAPANGMITDARSWNALWLKWRAEANEKTPTIDFDANIVIVALAHGPNNVSVKTLERDKNGAVDYRAMSTRRGGPGFGYLLMEVPRDGIKSVRNFPVPAPGVINPAVQLGAGRPGPIRPGPVRPGSSNSELPRSGEFIHVTVVGTLQTGIAAIGGETTGTTITSRNVTWELDLTKNRGLKNAAQKLQGKLVKVTGLLQRKRGVEVAERWIVDVKTLVLQSK